MPPRKNSVAMRHRAHMIASSVEEQEAALMEWRAKAREDKQKLHHIHTKINLHKKSAETTKRGGRWFVDCAALHQEAVSCELDLVKACASCAHVLPDSLRNEWAEQEVQYMELFNTLNGRVMGTRKEFRGLDQPGKRLSNEDVQRLFKKLSVLREECLDKKKEIDVEVERLLDEETWDGNIQDTPIETLQKLFQSTMESFERLCEWREGKGNPALIETYREGLETEGNKAIAQITMSKTKKEGSMRSLNDLRTISLILKTYGGEMELSTTASFIPEDVYQRVQRAVPHISRTSARDIVDEVLRRKRERIYARSVILQYKKKSAELLELFKKAMIAEEEIIKMQNSIDEEARMREECQQKTQKELERLRAAREAKDATYRAEEEAKRRKEAEKEHHIHCIREAEFQERLRRLRMYKEQQREIQEKERIVQETIAEENALKKAMQQERNAKRVKERTEEYEEKCRLRKKYQQEMEELNEARKRTLEAFFRGVERRLGVACDPKRVLQPTVSSQQSVPFVSFSQASKSVVHGYTVDDIMRDPRFRLQIALLEAGLHQTAYGREVISRGYHVPAAQRPSEDNLLRVDY